MRSAPSALGYMPEGVWRLVVLPSWSRSVRMVQRNLLVYTHGWMVIFSGFFEPLFYLLGIGLGLGIWLRRFRPLPLFLILPAMARLRPAVTIRRTGCG